MTKKEFIDEIMLQVALNLPPSYGDAGMKLQTVNSFNDTGYQALLIQREDEMITPSINLDQMYEAYQAGHSMEELVHEIIVIKMTENVVLDHLDPSMFFDYEAIKDKLDIRVCDKDLNVNHLEDLVQKDFGDLTATYRILLGESQDGGLLSTPVTTDMMEAWGITLEQLHEDATYQINPQLYRMEDVLDSILAGVQPENLLDASDDIEVEVSDFNIPMFIVTTDKQMNGASAILNPEVMKQVCEIVGSDGFILPSSIHECIFVPEHETLVVSDLLAMVNEVNSEVLDSRDILSDKVQHVDKETGTFINAEIWAKQELSKEKTVDQALGEMMKDNQVNKSPKPKGPSL